MKYTHKMKQQDSTKVKGQKRRVGHTIRQHEELLMLRETVLFCYLLRQEKAWHVLFLHLDRLIRGWWD